MKAKCPSCGAVYNVDESKLPESGAHANCAKCKTRLHIEKPVQAQKSEPFHNSVGSEQDPEPLHDSVDDGKAKIIICPNCDHVNLSSESCAVCGMVFTKEEQDKLTQRV